MIQHFQIARNCCLYLILQVTFGLQGTKMSQYCCTYLLSFLSPNIFQNLEKQKGTLSIIPHKFIFSHKMEILQSFIFISFALLGENASIFPPQEFLKSRKSRKHNKTPPTTQNMSIRRWWHYKTQAPCFGN